MATRTPARSLWRFAAAYVVAIVVVASLALALAEAIAYTPTRSFSGLFIDVRSIQVAGKDGTGGGRVAPTPTPAPPHG